MISPGECSDTLRAIGRFLELVGASASIVSDKGDYLEVAWHGRGGQQERQWNAQEVQSLRSSARLFRGTGGGQPSFGKAEFLRTIGRELDDKKAEGFTVVETVDGFWVTATVKGKEFRRDYKYDQLVARAQKYHRERSSS
jgi:hypothetical protein